MMVMKRILPRMLFWKLDFLNGMVMRDAIEVVIQKLEESGIGERKINYKMRDAAFSRQRYWGEPFR
jgi:leucyl-tRNA synthetase